MGKSITYLMAFAMVFLLFIGAGSATTATSICYWNDGEETTPEEVAPLETNTGVSITGVCVGSTRIRSMNTYMVNGGGLAAGEGGAFKLLTSPGNIAFGMNTTIQTISESLNINSVKALDYTGGDHALVSDSASAYRTGKTDDPYCEFVSVSSGASMSSGSYASALVMNHIPASGTMLDYQYMNGQSAMNPGNNTGMVGTITSEFQTLQMYGEYVNETPHANMITSQRVSTRWTGVSNTEGHFTYNTVN